MSTIHIQVRIQQCLEVDRNENNREDQIKHNQNKNNNKKKKQVKHLNAKTFELKNFIHSE